MQEARGNFTAALQQLRQEAREAIEKKQDDIVKDWFKQGFVYTDRVVCFNTDRTQDLSNYGFHQVLPFFIHFHVYILTI
jgi:hypothetical protein